MSRILIVHYHLNPGGVTRIIESQVQALKMLDEAPEIKVIAGYCENPEFYAQQGVELIIRESLNYLDPEADRPDILADMEEFFQKLLQPGDILHVHNLNLGKNPLLTLAVSRFVEKGVPVVNHAHDFAEDRPENYQFLKEVIGQFYEGDVDTLLYPHSTGFIHAALNTPDYERLHNCGASTLNTALLPNPVAVSFKQRTQELPAIRQKVCNQLGIPPDKKIITYPVRVIRRKNIGEYILLCMLLHDLASWLVTLPPKNPIEKEAYDQWVAFCKELAIPLYFEAGMKVDFEDLIQSSDLCFSTSIKEGFGMVYMEPWLMGTPVAGRKLKNITADLEQSGMQFPLLYERLVTPGNQDFGVLDQEQQMRFIRQLKSNPEAQKVFLEANPFVNNLLNSVDGSTIAHNQRVISQEYSLESYARRLEKIYQRVTG